MREQTADLAARVREAREALDAAKVGHAIGRVSYEDLAGCAKAFSAIFHDYAKAKFPLVKPRRIPYQSLLR